MRRAVSEVSITIPLSARRRNSAGHSCLGTCVPAGASHSAQSAMIGRDIRSPALDVCIDLDALRNNKECNTGTENRVLTRDSCTPQRGVRTEFVYVDPARPLSVHLCGDWASWTPIAMELETGTSIAHLLYPFDASQAQSKSSNCCMASAKCIPFWTDGVWSVITRVPAGYREFWYVVDGTRTVSRRHPTTCTGSANWRTVHGPPTIRRVSRVSRPALLRVADALCKFLGPSFATDEEIADARPVATPPRTPIHFYKGHRRWEHPVRVVAMAFAIYVAFAFVYRAKTGTWA